MLVLGIDPGSINTGWALLKSHGNKINYVASGVLSFDSKADFLVRLAEIKEKCDELVSDLNPDEVAFESLVFVKNPTSLIKLSQTRGVILSSLVGKYKSKIFEYSPNLIKASAAGHGHADKAAVKKVVDMVTGKREYKTHDESDAVAIALCHIMQRKNTIVSKDKTKASQKKRSTKTKGSSLQAALAHKIGK